MSKRGLWTPARLSKIDAEAKAAGKSVNAYMRAKGINTPSYYRLRKKLNASGKKGARRLKHATIELAPAAPSGAEQLVCLMGSADQIRAFLAGRGL